MAVRRVNPRELLQLARALESIAPLREKLAASGVRALEKLAEQLNPCVTLRTEIQRQNPARRAAAHQPGPRHPGRGRCRAGRAAGAGVFGQGLPAEIAAARAGQDGHLVR
ncbi:MAG: hypothetical protein WKG07_25515 [Hymenobacter sp.]